MREWIDRSAKRPRVRQFLASQAIPLVYTAALDLVSAEVLIDKLQRLLKHPVVYIDGGWQSLVNGLRQKAVAAGATVMTGTRVEAIEHRKDRVEGIRLRSGVRVGVGAIILATSPKEAAELMEESGLPELRAVTDALLPARAASLALALERLPNSLHAVVQDLTRPLFMSVQSLFSRVAPPGGALVYAFKPLDPRSPGDPKADEEELESLLDAAQPGWRGVTLKRQYLPSIAAIGALPTARTGGFSGRPGVRVAGLENLFLAGDWVGPEGFLADASFASARQAAQLAAQAAESRRVGTRSST
ncbi:MULTISPECIES: FAD-dependent oxidoreductase [unclassified Meiothermus]|uniref:FAD-dependent oxidoreductase n=1 Tax=unclassified Meiothermus TaxID=370471 RepID=UPI000D7BF229|nr:MULTISPECIES: FAD-dependent oxidoreductase [unclassified Meiothermus]PZA05944.1 hypothetical protein DNA98_15755 [Meiothermus sp. Pnk-1]RYM36452.1 FAD-dependent oxidoreductase [Meiothermus sp. PNK-Is4]